MGTTPVVDDRAERTPRLGLDEQNLSLTPQTKLPDRVLTKKLGSRNYPNSRLGLRWARIYKPDHMTTGSLGARTPAC